jgi:Icc-related predicted phosphoesterase
MRILALADIHGDLGVYEQLPGIAHSTQADVIVIAGDLLGADDQVHLDLIESHRSCARRIFEILGSSYCPVLYIMGNDDAVDMIYLEDSATNVKSIHGRKVTVKGVGFVGYQYCTPFMGGIFEKQEEDIWSDLNGLSTLIDQETVLVTHAPAYGILDRTLMIDGTGFTGHGGSRSILRLVKDVAPMAHLHGHIHGSFGRYGRHWNVSTYESRQYTIIDSDSLTSLVMNL